MDRRTFVKLAALSSAAAFAGTPKAMAQDATGSTSTLTSDNALEMAFNFAQSCDTNGQGLVPANPVRLAAAGGDHVGYVVDYNLDGAPNGYIVIDASCPNGIAEFSFEQGSISPYAAALMSNESLASAQHLSEDEQYAVKIDGLLYGAADRSGGPVLLNDGTIADIPMALSSVTGNGWIDATINTSDLYANYAMTAFKFFPSFIGSSQNRITYLTGRYACQVSALCACAGLYGMFDIWDCADEYLEMWDRTGTTVLEVKNGITFGTTNIGKGAVGFGDFCSARGKSISNRVNRSPTFAQYVLAVNAQQTSLFTAWPDPVGHSVAVEGYVSATNNSTGAALSVIVVADGWGDAARYLNFNYPALSNSTGTFFF